MEKSFYERLAYILYIGFELIIIYDLYKVIKFKKYSIIWIPIVIDVILFGLIAIFLYTLINISISFSAEDYLVNGIVLSLVGIFAFIRVVLVEKLKIKSL